MLQKSKDREEDYDFVKKAREKKIQMQYANMSSTYGRIFTPSRSVRDKSSMKQQMIKDEQEIAIIEKADAAEKQRKAELKA